MIPHSKYLLPTVPITIEYSRSLACKLLLLLELLLIG